MSTLPGLTALRADGTEFPVEVQLTPVLGADIGLVMAVVHDVGARVGLARALEAPDRSSAALDAIADPILVTDARGEVTFLNRAAEALAGRSRAWARGRRMSEVLGLSGQPDGDRLERALGECLGTGCAPPGSEILLPGAAGREALALDVSLAPIGDRSGAISGVAAVARDVTHAKRIARQLAHQATHDALTGLVNRREFERRLSRILVRADGEQEEHALCYLDLDGFKQVNDACGHLAGDMVLRQLSDAMRERMRSRDTLARLGGDEFGVLLEHCPPATAVRIAEELRDTVCAHRFVFDGYDFALGVSIGIVPLRPEGQRPEDVLRDADLACYQAKRRGGSRIQVHDRPGPPAEPEGEAEWIRHVVAAVEDDRLQLWAQAVLPLDRADERAPKLELLLRLDAPDGVPVLPGTFLPSARRRGLMPRIDRWVVREAARRVADWVETHPGAAPPTVAINLGEDTIAGGEPAAMVIDALRATGVPPGALCFEIGEPVAALHPGASARLIRELREAGCQVTLEHCGGGPACFGALRQRSVDYLKVAGRLVRGLASDPVDRAVVTALNEAGHAVGVRTIGAEVESAEALEALRRLGLDYAQGFEIRRPEPLEAALGRLAGGGTPA
jgi:diguanylate cyclase (GGDEF)-like protein/PAS domain S-box-containing protein